MRILLSILLLSYGPWAVCSNLYKGLYFSLEQLPRECSYGGGGVIARNIKDGLEINLLSVTCYGIDFKWLTVEALDGGYSKQLVRDSLEILVKGQEEFLDQTVCFTLDNRISSPVVAVGVWDENNQRAKQVLRSWILNVNTISFEPIDPKSVDCSFDEDRI
jgi:hypothetical protein